MIFTSPSQSRTITKSDRSFLSKAVIGQFTRWICPLPWFEGCVTFSQPVESVRIPARWWILVFFLCWSRSDCKLSSTHRWSPEHFSVVLPPPGVFQRAVVCNALRMNFGTCGRPITFTYSRRQDKDKTVDDVVIVKDGSLPRNRWPLDCVVQTYSSDNDWLGR